MHTTYGERKSEQQIVNKMLKLFFYVARSTYFYWDEEMSD